MPTAQTVLGADPNPQTLALLTQLKDYYGTVPAIRAAALAIAGSPVDNDQPAQLAALAQFVKTAIVYQADPVDSEFIQTPDVLLLSINATGTAAGDCDDHVLLFCALAQSLGIPCSAAGVASPLSTGAVDHVIAVAHLPDRDVDIDLCAKDGPAPAYPQKLLVTSPA